MPPSVSSLRRHSSETLLSRSATPPASVRALNRHSLVACHVTYVLLLLWQEHAVAGA